MNTSALRVASPALRALPAVPKRKHYFPPHLVATRVCKKWGVTFEAVAGWSRGGQIRAARADLVRQLRSCTAMTYAEIGAYLGGRHYSTILLIERSHR